MLTNQTAKRGWGLGKYWAILQTQLVNNLAYPADVFSRNISLGIFMFVFAQLWKTTYNAMGESVINGLTPAMVLWYMMFAETVWMSQPNLAIPITAAVQDGSVAYLLSKPYNFLLYQFSVGLGNVLLPLISNILTGSAVVWLLMGPPPGWQGWALGLLSFTLAVGINFCLHAMIGLLAFVVEDTTAFQWIYSKFVLLLGGVLIPLDFFPEWLQDIALMMPFAYTTYGPARLFIDPSWAGFVDLALKQAAWIAILALALTTLYRKLIARLVVNGG